MCGDALIREGSPEPRPGDDLPVTFHQLPPDDGVPRYRNPWPEPPRWQRIAVRVGIALAVLVVLGCGLLAAAAL